MTAFKLGFIGLIVGALLGFMVGGGETRYLNKTEKKMMGEATIWVWTVAFAIGGAIAGGGIGSKIEEEEAQEKIKQEQERVDQEAREVLAAKMAVEKQKVVNTKKALGILHYETRCYKEGRYWTGVTTWKDARNGNDYTLKTERSPTGELLTALNGKYIITHDVNSANKDVIPVLTDKSRDTIFRSLISRYYANESFTIENLYDLPGT